MNKNQIIINKSKIENYKIEINLINDVLEKVLGNDNAIRKKLGCHKKINRLSLEFENFWSDIKNFDTFEIFLAQSHHSLVIQVLINEIKNNKVNFESIKEIRKNSLIQLKNVSQSGRIIFSAKSKYEIVSNNSFGEGGNSSVFEVKHNDKVLVMKILREKNTDKIKRFKNEYLFSEKNKHKNIIDVIDQGVDCRGNHFIIMKKYSYNLRNYMDKKLNVTKEIPEIIAILTIFENILHGLVFLEQKGIVHRDMKPENIFLNDINDVVIADFGIAKFREKYEDIETKSNEGMGNYKYSAPEQKGDFNVSFATDVFAVGLILNELFTGIVPHGSYYKKISELYQLSYLDELVKSAISNEQDKRIKLVEFLNKISKFKNILENINNNSKIKCRTYYDIDRSTDVGENSVHKVKGTTSYFNFTRYQNHQVYPFSYMLFFEKKIFKYDFQYFVKYYNNVYWHECFILDLNSNGTKDFVFIVTGDYEINIDIVNIKNNYSVAEELDNIAINSSYFQNQGYSEYDKIADGVHFEDYAEESANYAAENIDINIISNKYRGDFKSVIFSIHLKGEKVFFLANLSKKIELYVYLDKNFHSIPISFLSVNYENILKLKAKKYKFL